MLNMVMTWSCWIRHRRRIGGKMKPTTRSGAATQWLTGLSLHLWGLWMDMECGNEEVNTKVNEDKIFVDKK